MKLIPATRGVKVADVAFVYDQFRSAVCQGWMVGVLVVNEQVGAAGAATCKMPVHDAVDWLLSTVMLNV